MKGKKEKSLKSVKVDENILNLVKKHKEKTYTPIGIFFEEAATEKLEREKQKIKIA